MQNITSFYPSKFWNSEITRRAQWEVFSLFLSVFVTPPIWLGYVVVWRRRIGAGRILTKLGIEHMSKYSVRVLCVCHTHTHTHTQGDSGGKVNIFGGKSIGHD